MIGQKIVDGIFFLAVSSAIVMTWYVIVRLFN